MKPLRHNHYGKRPTANCSLQLMLSCGPTERIILNVWKKKKRFTSWYNLKYVLHSPVISKRGYLHIMDDCSCRWSKCYVVSTNLIATLPLCYTFCVLLLREKEVPLRREGISVRICWYSMEHARTKTQILPQHHGTVTQRSVHLQWCQGSLKRTAFWKPSVMRKFFNPC